jgi:hypothetical protein
VVVDDLDIGGATGGPPKTHPELVVHPDAVLPAPITRERLEPIAWWDPQVVEVARDLELAKLAAGNRLVTPEPPNAVATSQRLRVSIPERDDHAPIVTSRVIIVKRRSSQVLATSRRSKLSNRWRLVAGGRRHSWFPRCQHPAR